MDLSDASGLEAGVDFPRDLTEFDRFFPDEDSCALYLEHLRWPTGFVCPRCSESRAAWRMGDGLLRCSRCRARISVTAGTIFEGTRKPLKLWFIAIWEIAGHKYGANALNLQRMLGLRSYETAWAWLHKLRRAMVRPGRDRLNGIIEIDEAYIGGVEEGARGRQTETKTIVAIAVEIREDESLGRVRMRPVPDVSAGSLEPFVTEAVEPGSSILTDAWSGYHGLSQLGYDHVVINQSSSPYPAHVLLPGVHRIASLVKRWLLGTYQGAVSAEHLSYYLDEYTFRFNRRRSRSRGLLFYRLLEQAVRVDHTPTDDLFLGAGRGRQPGTTISWG